MTAPDVEDVYELSPLQQGMLLHSLYDGDHDTYVAQRSFEIDGPLDADALRTAWERTVQGHTALRTSFHWEGLDKPLQVVHRAVEVTMDRADWSDVDDEEQRRRFDELLARERAAGFDPARAPLLRLHLVRLAEQRHGFVWTHHMLPVDGWSVPIITEDVGRRYASLVAGLPAPRAAPPYRDYIAWLQRQDMVAAKDFWTRTLGGAPDGSRPLGALLTDPADRAGAVDEIVADFPPALVAALRGLAARHQVTLNSVMQAAWAVVHQRHTGGPEVTFGFASSGRPAQLPDVDRMVGTFVNTLPMRLPVPDGGDLAPWLADIQARHSGARRYEYTPLAQIKSWTSAGPHPLFDVVVVLDNYPIGVPAGDGAQFWTFRPVNSFEKTSQPLTLLVTPEPASTLRLVFHRERFVPGAVAEMMAHLRAVLTAFPTATGVADLVAATRLPAETGRGPRVAYPDAAATLPELIRRQARTTPDAVAVAMGGDKLTYRRLLDRAEGTAAALIAAGVGPDHVVGICAERSPELVVGLLGTLLAGAAYLPLDPSLPPSRLAFMVGDSGADVVLAQREVAATAKEAGAPHVVVLEDLTAGATPTTAGPASGDAAYVIYTSGSTGRPKGVVVTHEAIVNRLLWMQETYRIGADDRVLQKTPFGFDVSVWELFWPLITGATLVVARPGGHQDSAYLARVIADQRVTVAHFVPSMLQLFLDEPAAAALPGLRRVVCSGEALPHPLARRFQALLPDVELHNLYGPTEAAVDVTWWDCARPAPPGVLPIGDPIANTATHVLDRRLMETPVGVPGELFLGGVALARGYLRRPGLTAERFVAHPLAGPGGRLYRTGDLVRRLADGSLEFLGRLDHQVKIHGYRIELAEVEHALAVHAGVREAAVVVRETANGSQLAAFVTMLPGHGARVLRAHLQGELPGYMVPATITELPALPLTHNGKVDRAALLASATATAAPAGTPATPLADTPRMAEIAEVYRDVLELSTVDPDVSFFDLGGDSFAAIRAIRRIEGATLGLLAAHPSARELAGALDQSSGVLLPLRPAAAGATLGTLVCIPFGGGSTIGYQPLAHALTADLALLAVPLPGHELGGDPELRPLEEVAAEAAEAVLREVEGPVSVYGHCVGVATAVEVARLLEEAGREVVRLFVGGSYPLYAGNTVRRSLRRRREEIAGDLAQLRYLQTLGGFTGLVDGDGLDFVVRALKHDAGGARAYFTDRWTGRGAAGKLRAPITFIVGTDDPETSRYEVRFRRWERFSADVEVVEVADGGHYFLQHQPDVLASIIEEGLRGPSHR